LALLLPYNINYESRNKYLYFFFKSLLTEGIDVVSSAKEWINKSCKYKAVLIHWPESLPRFDEHTDYDFINFTLERLIHFKKFSKIIYFVHNERAHNSFKRIDKKLYERIIDFSDAIFHFSNFSKNLYKLNYKFEKKQFIIPHGNYIKLDNKEFKRQKFLKELNFDTKKNIVTSLGAIRKKEEINLLYNFAKHYLKADCYFIYAGDLVEDFSHLKYSGKFLAYLKYLIFEKLRFKKFVIIYRVFKLKNLSKNIRVFPSTITDDLLVKICKASDILLITRSKSLNSGNISLGFTFGCYVLGPDVGNIGEILRRFNNMVFPLKNIKYEKLVKQSIKNINYKIIQENKKVAYYDWDWKIIGKNLKNAFSELEILN